MHHLPCLLLKSLTLLVSVGLGIGIECHWNVIESIEQGLSAMPRETLTFRLCLLTKLSPLKQYCADESSEWKSM